MKATDVKFPVYGIIIKTRVNPSTQAWETRLRKAGKFGKDVYSIWIYDLCDYITKIGYDVSDYCGKSDIYMINNKTELNNFWSFCKKLQKQNPGGWFVQLGLLPYNEALCPFGMGKCDKYDDTWRNIEESMCCWEEESNGRGRCPYETACT